MKISTLCIDLLMVFFCDYGVKIVCRTIQKNDDLYDMFCWLYLSNYILKLNKVIKSDFTCLLRLS